MPPTILVTEYKGFLLNRRPKPEHPSIGHYSYLYSLVAPLSHSMLTISFLAYDSLAIFFLHFFLGEGVFG
jgi:hypothetical protein